MAAIDVALEDTAEDGDPRDQLTRSPNDASDVAALATCLHDVLDGDDERVDAVRRQFEEDLGVYSVGEARELFRGERLITERKARVRARDVGRRCPRAVPRTTGNFANGVLKDNVSFIAEDFQLSPLRAAMALRGNVPGLTVSDAKSLLFKIKTA
ncbi:hypothetical protein VOLCADRAFT_107889, partial [Volvox carteri f. nagariensis]